MPQTHVIYLRDKRVLRMGFVAKFHSSYIKLLSHTELSDTLEN